MNTTHAAAGVYFPVTEQDGTLVNLTLQGQVIRADVYADGAYTVWAGFESIATGQLNGTEGPLMVFFAAEAMVWSYGIDTDREANAAAELAATIEHVDANEVSEAVAQVRADGAEKLAEAAEMEAQGTEPIVIAVRRNGEVRGHRKIGAWDPRHPARAAGSVRRAGERLSRWTQADEDAYGRYISDGLADTDGYYAPLDRAAWSYGR